MGAAWMVPGRGIVMYPSMVAGMHRTIFETTLKSMLFDAFWQIGRMKRAREWKKEVSIWNLVLFPPLTPFHFPILPLLSLSFPHSLSILSFVSLPCPGVPLQDPAWESEDSVSSSSSGSGRSPADKRCLVHSELKITVLLITHLHAM